MSELQENTHFCQNTKEVELFPASACNCLPDDALRDELVELTKGLCPSWDFENLYQKLAPWLKLKLSEREAETVEHVAQEVDELFEVCKRDGIPAPDKVHVRELIRALSPDVNFLERERLKARHAELLDWPELCNGDHRSPERHERLCKYHQAIKDLKRQPAALELEGK